MWVNEVGGRVEADRVKTETLQGCELIEFSHDGICYPGSGRRLHRGHTSSNRCA